MSEFTLVTSRIKSVGDDQDYVDFLKKGLDSKYKSMQIKEIQKLIRIEDAKRLRESQGLKTNKISKEDLISILYHWLDGDMKILTRSFMHVYNNSDQEHKEVDWVKRSVSSTFYGSQLVSAFESCTHPKIELLKKSLRFNKDILRSNLTLSRRLKIMTQDIDYELIIIEKENEIIDLTSKLEEVMANSSWEFKAEKLLSEGVSQVSVAKQLGKGLATIQRFVKKLKLNRSTEDEG